MGYVQNIWFNFWLIFKIFGFSFWVCSSIKRIEKIEKEIYGVFDLVLIFGGNGYGLCSKYMV